MTCACWFKACPQAFAIASYQECESLDIGLPAVLSEEPLDRVDEEDVVADEGELADVLVLVEGFCDEYSNE